MKIKYFLLAILLFSCTREDPWTDAAPRPSLWSISVGVDDLQDTPLTKSALTADDIETVVTDVTLAVYNARTGALCGEALYVTEGFDAIPISGEPAESLRIYAVANMGDLRSSFPETFSEPALQAITYRIPGYTTAQTGLGDRGLPMAGGIEWNEGDELPAVIPLKRLVAKLQATLSCVWPGRITSVRVFNLNAVLHPFGQSAARLESDLLSEQEICVVASGGVKSGEFVFYVPENCQGTVDGIAASGQKDPANDKLGAQKDLSSYLEAVVTGDQTAGASGTLTYRSYLGSNATSDFNIVRNSRYLWNIRYLPGNRQRNDWKHENNLSWKEFTYSLSMPEYLYLDQEDAGILYRNANNYFQGVFVGTSSNETIPTVTYSVSPGNNAILGNTTLSGSYFQFTGLHPGVASVTATAVDPGHPDGVSYSQDVRVLDFKREFFIRTPVGDYYPGDRIPVPFGTTWSNLQVGMKKTRAGGGVQTICPVVCGEDNLTTVFVEYGFSAGNSKLFHYADYRQEDVGKSATFEVTFENNGYAYDQPTFYVFLYYNDYLDKRQSMADWIDVRITDSDTEILNLNADRESAIWTDQSISFSATSTSIHNGNASAQTDITVDAGYEWTTNSSYAQITLSGGKRVLTASRAGDVTVTVRKGSISASKTVRFDDKPDHYELTLTPGSLSLEEGESAASALGFTVTNNGVAVNGLTAADLTWHSENSTVATVSAAGIVTAVKPGSTRVYATYAGVSSNKVQVTVTQKETPPDPGQSSGGGLVGNWENGGEIEL